MGSYSEILSGFNIARVLYIPGYYFPVSDEEIVTSGDLRYSINIAIGLSNNGYDVTILNKRFNKYKKHEIPTDKYERLKFEYYNNGLYKLFDSSFDISFNRFLLFRQLIKNSDIIISNTPLSFELLTLYKSKKKYIYNVSGLFDKRNYSFSLKEIGLFLFVNLLRDNLKKLNFKIAHKVNTSSYFEIEDLKIMDMSEEKLTSISSGYDSRFYFPKLEEKENILFSKSKNSILHVSRITPAKGIVETIEAFSVLNKNKFELKIIGNELSDAPGYGTLGAVVGLSLSESRYQNAEKCKTVWRPERQWVRTLSHYDLSVVHRGRVVRLESEYPYQAGEHIHFAR